MTREEEMKNKDNNNKEYEKDLNDLKEQILKEGDTLVSKRDLLERFCEIDKEYNGRPWNLLQILTNINILIGQESCEDAVSREEHRQLAEWLKDYKRLLEQKSCGDAVSRKDLERLKRWRFSYDTNTTIPKSDLFVRLTDIRALPSVKSTQGWIPVSERLPENETCVLTTIKIPNRIARVRSGWYDSGFIHNDNGDVWKTTDMEVLAWMPLPKPYKTEMEGEE